MAGVEHTAKFLEALTHMVVEAIHISKTGVGFSAYRRVMGLMGEMKIMIHEAKESLPELSDLDTEEALELGDVAYKCVAKIVMAASPE